MAEDGSSIAEGFPSREAGLRQEIEQHKHEKAVLEEKHQFEILERLKVKDELQEYVAGDKEVISKLESRISRLEEGIAGKLSKERRLGSRRSQRLANIEAENREHESDEDVEEEEEEEDEVDSDGDGSTASEGDSPPPPPPPRRGRGRPRTKTNENLQMSGNKRQMKKMGRIKNVRKHKYRAPDHVQYRCNMLAFLKIMQKVRERLTKSHLELLQQTPFWPLISAFYNGLISENDCKKSESDINEIIQCYNSNSKCFEFGSRSASLTPEDISAILGLPQEGETLRVTGLFGVNRYTSDFVERYFKDEKRVKKTLVDDGLEKALQGKRETDREDVVRLIILELFITFLFCNAGSTIGWKLVRCCEELENMSRYSWAKAVADFLSSTLEKTSGQYGPYSTGGCVVVLLFWLCERSNLIQPVEGRETITPALIKWNIQELHLKLQRMKDFEELGRSFDGAKENQKRDGEDNEEDGNGTGENEETQEEDRREETETDRGGEESVSDDIVVPLEDELRAQMSRFRSSPILKTLSRDNENLRKRKATNLRDKVQYARVEVERAQGEVDRLAEKLERKKEKASRLKRKLKEEKKEKRKLEEENEILNAEKRSLLESVTKLVKTLDAERKAVRNLVKEKAEVIKENRQLKDQLNQGSCSTAAKLGENTQTQVSPEQSYVTSFEIRKRALDLGFDNDKGCEKYRKLGDDKGERNS
ncbi:putative aminotransferase-like, plant mobile domain-containing protein [Rosa chinensis]|uniref:Putative aminotransferase-like, plant mobile domain-containing protein n=1 Tax=Rosa chinensis TaxID=74649 RepID=A0A2P6P6C0_ROSCH|nr:uncharacterized protein LOC112180970 [Rosa chinensis]PRQ17481.1 putative aminotransferase-like, plant mobile domain-containing protein [Rosa chinensis]